MRTIHTLYFCCSLFLLGMSTGLLAQSSQGYTKGSIDSLNLECKNYWFSNTSQSIELGTEAIQEASAMRYGEGMATAYNNTGVAFWVRGEFDRALELYYRSINVRDSVGGKLGLGNTFHNIGNIHKDRKDYGLSKTWFNKALEIRIEISDSLGQSYSLNNLGLIAQTEKNYDSALFYLTESLTLREALKDVRGMATSHMSLSKLFMELGEYNKSESLLFECLEEWKSIEHLQGQSDTYLELAKLNHLQNKKRDRDQHLELGIQLSRAIGAKPQLFRLYQFGANKKAEDGDSLSAYSYLKQAFIYRDSIFNEQKEGLIHQYNVDQISYSNNLLEKENQIQKEQILRQNAATQGIVIIAILLVVLVFMLYRVLRIRMKASKKLAAKNVLIAKQKEEILNANLKLERKVEVRTQDLKESNAKILKYSFINAHKIRGPVARLLGLAYLCKVSEDHELRDLVDKIDISAQELDDQIRWVTKELSEHIDVTEEEGSLN